jgi:transposase
VKDLRSILRLTYEQGLSVRAISARLQISKISVSTYLLRAREAGLSWPLPPIYESEAALQRALFRRVGRPPQDLSEPEWPRVVQELKRKGVTGSDGQALKATLVTLNGSLCCSVGSAVDYHVDRCAAFVRGESGGIANDSQQGFYLVCPDFWILR